MSAKTTEFNVTPSLQFVGHGSSRTFCGVRAKHGTRSGSVTVTLESYRNPALCGGNRRKCRLARRTGRTFVARVGIVGAGATGAYLAARFARAGIGVTLAARGTSARQISREGITIVDGDGRWRATPTDVIDTSGPSMAGSGTAMAGSGAGVAGRGASEEPLRSEEHTPELQ